MDTPVLECKKVSKNFGALAAVQLVSFALNRNEILGMIGPNGAGKTTLFNLISGALKPTSGRLFLLGKEITSMASHRRAYLGISRTFQITNLFPGLTVLDNLVIAAQALQKTKFVMFRPVTSFNDLYQRVEEVLVKVGMIDKRREVVKNLSYGEQRQIEVAMALFTEPRLLLLDEPTAGLAPAESSGMVSMLKGLDENITILIIEHDMDVAFEIADRITVLSFGKILAEGGREEIRANETVQQVYLGVE